MFMKLIRFITAASLSDEQYENAKEDMYKNNIMMLRVLAAVATAIFFICTLAGLFVDNMKSKMTVYIVGLVLSTAVLLTAFFVHNKKVHVFCMYFFDIMLLAAGLLITLVSAQHQLTVTLIPIAILLPLFFDMKPYKFLLSILITDLIYLCFAPMVKPPDILFLDMVDVLVFSFAGVLIGTVITKVKIERYVYANEVSHIANYDGLTECLNRTAYNRYLEGKVDRRSDKFMVVMIDINGLKHVNDNFGHEAGDEMIIAVARNLRTVFDSYGKVFRIGGDEFVAFLEIDTKTLDEVIETLRKRLSENNGKYVKGITVSVGYADAKANNDKSLEDIINIADQKMYEDKQLYYERSGEKRR